MTAKADKRTGVASFKAGNNKRVSYVKVQTCQSVGVSEGAEHSSIPMSRCIIPLLHDKLGTCGNLVKGVIDFAMDNVLPLPEKAQEAARLKELHYNQMSETIRDVDDWRSRVKRLLSFVKELERKSTSFNKALESSTNNKTEKSRSQYEMKLPGMREDLTSLRCENISVEKDGVTRGEAAGESYGKDALKSARGRIQQYRRNIVRNEPLLIKFKTEYTKQKIILAKLMKKHKKHRELTDEIYGILYENGVPRNLYYNGSLNGHASEKLLANHEKIFDQLKELFIQKKKAKDPSGFNDTFLKELDAFFSNLTNLAGLLDDILRTISRQNVQYSDQQLDEFDCIVEKFSKLWRNLKLPPTVKLHHIESHAGPMLRKYRCLGNYSEENIERMHRVINQKHTQFGAIRSLMRRYQMILDEDKIACIAGVEESRHMVKDGRKRVFSEVTEKVKEEKNKIKEEHKRSKRIKNLTMHIE